MSAEFTFYALFVMLAVTTGFIFQFYLGQIKKIKSDIKKMNASIVKLHESVRHQENTVSNIKNKNRSNVIPFRRRNRRLSGNLELEYQGSRASTRAIFHVDEET